MFNRIANNQNDQSLAVQMRRKRFALFTSLLSQLQRPVHILDIGGTENFWKTMNVNWGDQIFVTLLNIRAHEATFPNLKSKAGDARDLDMENQSFDVVFSNSVIEHVGDFNDQTKMAKEVMRVGKRYFVQTPNKFFPIEPHFLFPFFQFLPLSVRVFLLRKFNLGWYKKISNEVDARREVEAVRLLSKREFTRLFPHASIHEEKFAGMTKSFVAFNGWDQ